MPSSLHVWQAQPLAFAPVLWVIEYINKRKNITDKELS